jgi:tripartite-type tricarboxylate transporter receptor subunit TctC
MTGRIDFYFIPLGSALALIKDGKLTPLAVSTVQRTNKLPDVPTIREAGLQESGFELWVGLFAPAKTPSAIVAKLHAAAQKAMQVDQVKQRLDALSLQPMPMTLEQFYAYFRRDLEDTSSVIEKAKIQIQ